MQRWYSKILLTVVSLLIIFNNQAFSQQSSHRLRTADSLFTAKRYMQSFEHYKVILGQSQYTPAMLLKMAFIQEGLGKIGEAMYYLNLYHLATNDATSLEKMSELAEKFSLQGYDVDQTDRVVTMYRENQVSITAAVSALLVLMLAIMFYTKTKLQRKPVVSFFFMFVVLIMSGAHLYYSQRTETAIIKAPATYVMSGPSSAAPVVAIINDGHKVEVIGEKDVWLKIKWSGETAFVKKGTLLPISL